MMQRLTKFRLCCALLATLGLAHAGCQTGMPGDPSSDGTHPTQPDSPGTQAPNAPPTDPSQPAIPGQPQRPTPPPPATPPPLALPSADAGSDQTVEDGVTVQLTGRGADPAGGALMFHWAQTSGTAVTLANADSPMATFTSPETSGELTFQLSVTSTAGTASDVVKVTVRAAPIVFASCYDDNAVVSFRRPSNAASPPAARTILKGTDTRLITPCALVLDKTGGLLVSTSQRNRIAGFYNALSVTGNVTPERFVTNPDAMLNDAEGLAYDAGQDLLFAGNFDDFPWSVTVYANASQLSLFQPAIPARRFTSVGLRNPRGMRLVGSGELYVTCSGSNSVSVYASASTLTGMVPATREIHSTELDDEVLMDLHVDGGDRLYVVDASKQRIVVFQRASTLNGYVAPDAIISIEGAQGLRGVTVDAAGNGYVTDYVGHAIYLVRDIANRNGVIAADITIPDSAALPLKGPWHMTVQER